jgi:hypothetical protein
VAAPLKRKPTEQSQPPESSSKRRRLESHSSSPSTPNQVPNPQSTRHSRRTFSLSSMPPLDSNELSQADRDYYEFHWRVLNLCKEFYEAATELVVSSDVSLINLSYDIEADVARRKRPQNRS